jgi:hypothetical protein
MNAIPTALNGTMPFSRSAALAAGVPAWDLDSVHVKNGVAHARTKLAWLGDVIPVAPIAKVFSVGDCAIIFGTALLIFAGMQRPERISAAASNQRSTSRTIIPSRPNQPATLVGLQEGGNHENEQAAPPRTDGGRSRQSPVHRWRPPLHGRLIDSHPLGSIEISRKEGTMSRSTLLRIAATVGGLATLLYTVGAPTYMGG